MLIEASKKDWLDSFIALRDEYAHYSSLSEYKNFWVSGKEIEKLKISTIEDFHKPSIVVNNTEHNALDYMLSLKQNLMDFIQKFLQLCEFTDNRP